MNETRSCFFLIFMGSDTCEIENVEEEDLEDKSNENYNESDDIESSSGDDDVEIPEMNEESDIEESDSFETVDSDCENNTNESKVKYENIDGQRMKLIASNVDIYQAIDMMEKYCNKN